MAGDSSKYLKIFLSEAEEHLNSLDAGLLRLEESSEDLDLIQGLMRNAHTLKGAARMMGFEAICNVAHKMEDIMVDVEKGRIPISPGLIDRLLLGADTIKALIAKQGNPEGPEVDHPSVVSQLEDILDKGGVPETSAAGAPPAPAPEAAPPAAPAEPAPSPPPPPAAGGNISLGQASSQAAVSLGGPASPPPKSGAPARPAKSSASPKKANGSLKKSAPVVSETIRVEISKVDQLLDMIGEMMISRIKMEDRLGHSRSIMEHCDALGEEGRKLRDDIFRFTEELTAVMVEMTYLTQEIQNRAMKIRMLPAETIFDTFNRTVRDLSRTLGKKVKLVISGRKTELDKRVLEEIKDSLIHIIRNSVDHGIEMPDVRVANGKPAEGTIWLSASLKGDSVLIEIKDDGGGIDPERVKTKALERGILDEKRYSEISDEEAIYLVMSPGFSTAEIITDISGRGVGMDVVKTNVEKLKGDVTLESELGQGTRLLIRLPMTLSTMNVLLLRSAGETYAFPLNFLEETCIVKLEDLVTEGGRTVLTHRGRTIAVAPLAQLLGLEAGTVLKPGQEQPLAIVRARGQTFGFLVDEFIGHQEIVVKTMGDHLRHVQNVSGATIMGNGEPALILNVSDVVSLGMAETYGKTAGAGSTKKAGSRSILVVDDSITTRTMEKNVLETAGYQVDVAVNGEDGLQKLRSRKYDLVVSDIEMPGMDGFELIRNMKREEGIKEIPVVIVSSKSTDEYKKRGIEVGAKAYITKGTFDQANLIGTVKRLIR